MVVALKWFASIFSGVSSVKTSANRLKRLLSQPTVEPSEMESQPSLF
jgi:hypothetical protein